MAYEDVAARRSGQNMLWEVYVLGFPAMPYDRNHIVEEVAHLLRQILRTRTFNRTPTHTPVLASAASHHALGAT